MAKSSGCRTNRRHQNRKLIPISMIGFPIRIGEQINGIIYIYQDISERKSFEKQITHQAFHDALTGLPNRALFAERLDRALERNQRRPELFYALLMIDLDKFKAINDSFGHAAGDQLLIQVGKRLSSSIRAMDTVARLGGDEFAVILEEFTSQEELIKAAERMHLSLSEPFTFDSDPILSGASVGIVPNMAEYTSTEDILRDADIAMYQAKQKGKGILLFDKRMHQEIIESINLESELRETLARDGLTLYYQPIVSVVDQRLEGMELIRKFLP